MKLWCRLTLFLGFGLGWLLTASPGHAQNVSIKGGLGGYPAPPKIIGTTAFLVEGNHLVILNVSDPDHPQLKSRTKLSEYEFDFDVIGTTLFLVAGPMLEVYDVSDPSAPVLKGSGNPNVHGGVAKIIALSPTSVMVEDAMGSQLTLIDAANPNAPVSKSTLKYSGNFPHDAAVSGNTLLTAGSGFPSLRVFELNGATTPTLKGSKFLLGYGMPLTVAGSRAYAIGGQSLYVLDLSDPAKPTVQGFVDGVPGVKSLRASADNKTVVLSTTSTLQTVDVSDPTAPALLGTVQLPRLASPEKPMGIAYTGNLVCRPDVHGYQFIDVTHPEAPALRGRYETPTSYIENVAFVTDTLACAAGDYALTVLDLSDPGAPKVAGRAALGSEFVWSLQVSGNLALVLCFGGWNYGYTSLKNDELWIFDLSNPAAPTLKSRIPVAPYYIGGPTNLYPYFDLGSQFAVLGSRLYMTDGTDQLAIYDISRPEAPEPVQTVTLAQPALGFYLRGTQALAVTPDRLAFTLYDLADPLSPRQVTSIQLPPETYTNDSMTWSACYLPVLGETGPVLTLFGIHPNQPSKFSFFSLSDPAAPSLIAEFPMESMDHAFASPGTLYSITALGDNSLSFDVLDTSHPDSPQLAYRQTLTNLFPYCFAARGNRALAGTTGVGLTVLEYTGVNGKMIKNAAGKSWALYE